MALVAELTGQRVNTHTPGGSWLAAQASPIEGRIYSRAALFVVEPKLAAEGQPFALYDELLPFSLTFASGSQLHDMTGRAKGSDAAWALLDAAYSAGSDASPLHRATTTAALPEDGAREEHIFPHTAARLWLLQRWHRTQSAARRVFV